MNNGYEYREELGAAAANRDIVEYLTRRYPAVGRDEWLARIGAGRVLLDDVPASPAAILRSGQRLCWIRPPWEEPDAPLAYAILYRDDHLLAVAKPAGLPTMPGGGRFMDNTLWTLVRRRFPDANPLHRLGRGTSGVLLFARTPEAFAVVAKAWNRSEVRKIYRTLVVGSPLANGLGCEFAVDVPIARIPHPVLGTIHAAAPGGGQGAGDEKGKAAHSHVWVLERRDGCTLVDVQITTGRPHQIRIHLAAVGHPLVGDPLYEAGGRPKADSRALPGDLGYHLHSRLLGFAHPVTKEWVEISCAPPPLLRTSGEHLTRTSSP